MTDLSPPAARTLPGIALEAKHTFRAMNTGVEVTLADWRESHRLPGVEALFRAFEARFSRFSRESELSRFNARTEPDGRVSAEMWDLLCECRAFFEITGGVFNPLVLDALTSVGYSASFELVEYAPEPTGRDVPSFDQMAFGDAPAVQLPLGLGLDFGGIGKGYCVDLAVEHLTGCDDFVINAGGDIFAAGLGPDGQPWRVAVADPQHPGQALTTLALSDRAVATSWTTKRRWRVGSGWANHLIDPRTGLPVDNGVAGVTVVAPAATEADVFAKTALILGPDDGCAFLEAQQVDGLMVLLEGTQVCTSGWMQHIAH